MYNVKKLNNPSLQSKLNKIVYRGNLQAKDFIGSHVLLKIFFK